MPLESSRMGRETRTIPPEIPNYPDLNIKQISPIMEGQKRNDLLFLIEKYYNALKDIMDQKNKGKKFAGEMIVELGDFQKQLKELAESSEVPEEVQNILKKFLEKVEEERQKEIKIIRDKLPLHKAFKSG